jgi:glycosyltransferase involved in cell wall biosynthesis
VPLVSIVTPVYNAARFLRETLDSVFRQSFSDFEMLAVNDGSTDGSGAILEEYRRRYADRLHYWTQPNRGPSAARNVAFRHVRGRWFVFLDSDDMWSPRYLETHLEFLRVSPPTDVLSTNALHLGGPLDGRPVRPVRSWSEPLTFEGLLHDDELMFTMAFVRSAMLERVDSFDESIRYGEDHDFWLRLLRVGARFAYNPVPLAWRRIHDANASGDREVMSAGIVRMFRQFLDRSLSDSERLAVEAQIAKFSAVLATERGKRLLVERAFDEASDELHRAVHLKPSPKLRAAAVLARVAPRLLRRVYIRRFPELATERRAS